MERVAYQSMKMQTNFYDIRYQLNVNKINLEYCRYPYLIGQQDQMLYALNIENKEIFTITKNTSGIKYSILHLGELKNDKIKILTINS